MKEQVLKKLQIDTFLTQRITLWKVKVLLNH